MRQSEITLRSPASFRLAPAAAKNGGALTAIAASTTGAANTSAAP
jgi:hypothetical protein